MSAAHEQKSQDQDQQTQTLHALSTDTVHLIGSCQVITSVFSVVKELVENSLDAGATSIDVKLEEYGLEKIEVVDNGYGIKSVDVPYMAKRHYTSKISSTDDLNFLMTYGFRGEALGSLCAVSQVTVTTKTAEDKISFVYTIGGEGEMVDKKPSHNGKGTTVTSKNLFHNIPVRKQYYSHSQRKKEDLRKIELLMMVYALVKPELRITLKHGKEQVFQKTSLKDIKSVLNLVFGRHVAGQTLHMEKCTEESKVSINAFLPKPGSDLREMSLANPEKTFVAVNKRPVYVPEFNKILRNYYSNCHGLETYRYPICFVCLDIATNEIDVNVDPNKTKVFFQQKMEIQNALEEMLLEIYGPLENVPSWHYREANGEPTPSKTKVSVEREKVVNKPLITYSKRPGDESTDDIDSFTSASDVVSSDNLEKESSNEKKDHLPSFTLTFHSKQEDKTDSDLSVGSIVTPEINNSEANAISVNLENRNNDTIIETFYKSSSNTQISFSEQRSHLDESDVNKNCSKVSDDVVTNQNDNKSKSMIFEIESQKEDISTEKDLDIRIMDFGDDDDLLFLTNDLLNGNTSTPADVNSDLVPDSNNTGEEFTNVLLNNGNSAKNCAVQEVTVITDTEERDVIDKEAINTEEMNRETIQPVSHISCEDWSRGNVGVGTSLLQPVKLLPPTSGQRPGKRPLSPSKEVKEFCSSQPRRKSAKLSLLTNQPTLLDMVASQIPNKPESPFSQFYKAKYPSLSQSMPDESDDAIEKRLRQDWDGLRNDEKVSYREKCWQDTKRYEKDVKSMTKKYKSQRSPGKKKGSERVKNVLKKRLYCQEKTIKVPINNIRNPKHQEQQHNKPVQIVGPAPDCDDSCWYCIIHEKLYLVNVWRLAEVSLYKKLKAEHKLPFTPCDPIVLDSRLITERGISVLDKLAKESPAKSIYFHITDERLVSNGFDIVCHYDSNGKLCSELSGICCTIPAYDVKDLNLLLGVLSSNPNASLSQSRTLKATYYLQGEAERMARQTSGRKSWHDVQALLDNGSENINQPCIHHKPIFKELSDISSEQFNDD